MCPEWVSIHQIQLSILTDADCRDSEILIGSLRANFPRECRALILA